MTTLWIVLGAAMLSIAAALAWRLVLASGERAAAKAWKEVCARLDRRHDLIPGLMDLVRGTVSHERSLFEEVEEARIRAMCVSGGAPARAMAERALSIALADLFAVAEASPAFAVDAGRRRMRTDMAAIEQEIQTARRAYDQAALEQNRRLRRFPGNLAAAVFHFNVIPSFDLECSVETNAPGVSGIFGLNESAHWDET